MDLGLKTISQITTFLSLSLAEKTNLFFPLVTGEEREEEGIEDLIAINHKPPMSLLSGL